ncbi:beta-1,4-N-acetylgalactosaminyltransferase bre-4 isoform X1 [Lingula anatina]|uniref:Beta-1,4-N-acetylgalactosaminyltransferase bre-4 isoform X1 n=1 Tax=Lingula anatina TaxID=7574 RepID=A0A2R2MMV9_LINAN|nr:beta-1,4-N-acetylgalactosaminyltransferase bre-4 isoform X1 [Lingula anatina]|eukprot:XP_023931540.1 beta-1,4-N-acetylgalactosaminyltransferase bre-4 isoform X1 [Lingula anatina]
MAETSGENHDVELGGHWSPRDCLARSRVIIIIPYRDRLDHLKRWLHHYHPILKRQLLDYRVVVTEQYGNGIFNKGRIMNAAFLECRKAYRFDCVIFHDVDMLLENDLNMYVCGNDTTPKHLSPAVDQFHYKLFYLGLVGGVLAIPVNTFVKVNGYSNQFWGWGGEDDDMWERFVAVNATVKRPPLTIGRYTMNKHASRRGQANYTMIYPLLKTSRSRMRSDGLNNISYSLVTVKLHRLYTHLVFDVDTSAS